MQVYFASDDYDDDHDIHLEIGQQKSFWCDECDFDGEYNDDMKKHKQREDDHKLSPHQNFHHERCRQKTMRTTMMMRTMMIIWMMMTMISTLK